MASIAAIELSHLLSNYADPALFTYTKSYLTY